MPRRTTPTRRRLIGPMAAVLVSVPAACGGGEPAPSNEPPASEGPYEPGMGEGAAHPGVDLATLLGEIDERGPDGALPILGRLRPPLETGTEVVENRHRPGVMDTVRTLTWRGLEVEVYEVTSTGKEIVRSITVTSDDFRTDGGLTVGATRAEVTEALGEPARTEDETVVYEIGDGPDDPTPTLLRISYDADRVRRLEWSYTID